MLIQCTECYQQDDHLLDEALNEVVCLHCGEQIKVPQTTKKTLSSLKQVRKHVPQALEFKCSKCDTVARPLLKKAGTTTIAVCKDCGERSPISSFFVEALKMAKPEDTDESDQGGTKSGTRPSFRKADKVPALQAKPRQASSEVPKKGKKPTK